MKFTDQEKRALEAEASLAEAQYEIVDLRIAAERWRVLCSEQQRRIRELEAELKTLKVGMPKK